MYGKDIEISKSQITIGREQIEKIKYNAKSQRVLYIKKKKKNNIIKMIKRTVLRKGKEKYAFLIRKNK